jgi:hypothetical protein
MYTVGPTHLPTSREPEILLGHSSLDNIQSFCRLTKDQLNLNATFATEQRELWLQNRTGKFL